MFARFMSSWTHVPVANINKTIYSHTMAVHSKYKPVCENKIKGKYKYKKTHFLIFHLLYFPLYSSLNHRL